MAPPLRAATQVERHRTKQRQLLTKLLLIFFAISSLCIAVVPIYFAIFHNFSRPVQHNTLNLTSVTRFWKVHQEWGVPKGPLLEGMRDLVGDFDVASRRCNFTYMLHKEAALGAFRHHGVLPWDHSVPVLLSKMSIRSLQLCFIDSLLILERRRVENSSTARWIIHRNIYVNWKHPKDLDNQHIPWPYLEVHMYEVQKGFIVDIDEKSFRFPVTHVLPPAYYAFENFLLPSYRCLSSIIDTMYDSNVCCLPEGFLVRERQGNKDISFSEDDVMTSCVRCPLLFHYFPFVIRRLDIGPAVVMEEVQVPGGRETSLRYFHRPVCEPLNDKRRLRSDNLKSRTSTGQRPDKF